MVVKASANKPRYKQQDPGLGADMTYEFHLNRPLPPFVLDSVEIIASHQTADSEFVYKIKFKSESEHQEFCEIVYEILDFNGSEEAS